MQASYLHTPATTIDEYLALQTAPVRAALEKLRQTIKSVVPDAEEAISYQIPSFKYHGMLVGFAAFEKHCSFFVMNPTFTALFKEDLKAFKTSKGTIQFTLDKPIPTALVKKIVQARVQQNLEKKSVPKKGKV